MIAENFEQRVQALRPRLHRYCARITGSAVDGEDAVQDTLVKALGAQSDGVAVQNLEVWLLRIAHNTCLDLVRSKMRHPTVPLMDELEDIEGTPAADSETIALGFQSFLRLPELQRCAVVLKDVLGHSVDEIADIAGCTFAAAKSALQRGRVALRQLAQDAVPYPSLSEQDWQKMNSYVQLFQRGDFDAIRLMLADDVKLDLVNRLKLEGKEKVDVYFGRYSQESKWGFAFGAVEGRPAMLVFDRADAGNKLAHFVLLGWRDNRIVAIRDFLFAPYALEALDWQRAPGTEPAAVTLAKPGT